MFFIRTVVMTLFLVAYAQGNCFKSHQLETGEIYFMFFYKILQVKMFRCVTAFSKV